MSGFSDSTTCPNCGKDCDEYTDWKPYNYTVILCLECGLSIHPVTEYLTLEELNSYRLDNELEPLAELPEQTFNEA